MRARDKGNSSSNNNGGSGAVAVAARDEHQPLRPVRSELHRQFIRFCENTTIRGIPRIVKSDSRRVRLLWVFFVALLFASCMLCLSLLILQFIEYDVMHPPRVLKDANSPFPSITICNARPLSSHGKRRLRSQGWKYPRAFATAVELATRHLYFFNLSTRHVYYNFSGSLGFAAYLESLPAGAADLGHSLRDFIIDCRAVVRNGSARNQHFCSRDYGDSTDDSTAAGTFRAFVHGNYLNCYTLDLSEHLRNSTSMVEMAIYLDNPWSLDNLNCVDCYTMDISTQLSGAVFTIHAGDTYPDVNHEAIHLKSGSLTEVKLKNVLNVQKQPPYGRCSPDTPKMLSLFGSDYSYSEDSCRQVTIQRDILHTCGCQAIEYPLVMTSGFTYCTGLSEFMNEGSCDWSPSFDKRCTEALERVNNFIKCKKKVISKYAKDVVPSCTLPCSFFSYQTERSTSDWPAKSFQLQMLQSRVYRRLRDRPELEDYRQAISLQIAGDSAGAYRLLRGVDHLERNLLSIQLIRPNFDLHKVEEKEVLSLTSFLSQIGGLLSIFIGLTMVSIVELIDFLLHCYEAFSHRPRAHSNDATLASTIELDGFRAAPGSAVAAAATAAKRFGVPPQDAALETRHLLLRRGDDHVVDEDFVAEETARGAVTRSVE